MKKEEYIAAMQKINPSEQFLRDTLRILQSEEALTCDGVINLSDRNKHKKQLRVAGAIKVAAILVLILLSTAGITAAAAKFNVIDLFKGYFREPLRQEGKELSNENHTGSNKIARAITSTPLKKDNEFIEEASSIVSSTVTANGLKLSARGAVGDSHMVYIAVDVETVNGDAFSKKQLANVKGLSFHKVWLQVNNKVLGQYCYVTRVDDGSKPGKATFVLRNSIDIQESLNHISVTFTNLTAPNTDKLVEIGSEKSLLQLMNELGEASEKDFQFMGARFTGEVSEKDRSWFLTTKKKYGEKLKKEGISYNGDYDSYYGKIDAYMEKAIMDRGGIIPKYCIKRTNIQTTFCTEYPTLAVSNIGIRNNQLCVKFELNGAMSFEKFCDLRIVMVNKKNGSILRGTVDASQPVNGADDSQADMVDGKIISCAAQFNGISGKEILKDYYFAFGEEGVSTLYEGEWKMDFDLAYKDTSREYSVSKNVDLNGKSRELKKITLSPISLQLEFQMVSEAFSIDQEKDREDLSKVSNIEQEENIIKLILKDNTEIVLDNQSQENDTISSVLPVIIDLDQVSAVEINDNRIKLSE